MLKLNSSITLATIVRNTVVNNGSAGVVSTAGLANGITVGLGVVVFMVIAKSK